MPHPTPWRSRLSRCGHTALFLLLISAATLSTPPMSQAAEPAETPPAGAGPLTPVRRDPPPASAQSAPSQKQAPAAKKPAITMPPSASTSSTEATPAAPTQPASKPQPKQADQAIAPSPKAAKPQPKQAVQATPPASAPVATPQPKQAEEAIPPRPHRKAPSTKTASTSLEQPDKKAVPTERRSRSTEVVEQTQRRERVYRDAYGWPEDEPFAHRGARAYPPPPVYGEIPGEMGPAPFAPPWYYRNRPLAWGPYPGMGVPRGPW
jgi:hypothetical protein